MEKHSVAFKEMIYDLMNGQIDLEKYPTQESNIVKNEFEKGMPCDVCYEQVYEANKRLCERLGVEEDKDVELIVNNLLQIAKYQAMKMYDYGKLFTEL